MITYHNDSEFEIAKARNLTIDPLLWSKVLHIKTTKGLPLYNSYYKDLENYVMSQVKILNNHLRRYFPFQYCKSSALLDLKQPTMSHYKQRFPEKQYLVDDSLFMKPACCANAFKIWAHKKNSLKSREIIHEVSDVYRKEDNGAIRSLRKNNYFSMADYHCITKAKTLKSDFLIIREGLINTMNNLFKDWSKTFQQVVRIAKSKLHQYQQIIKLIDDEGDIDVQIFEDESPYYQMKYELCYTGENRLFTLGTIQVDYVYPQLFKLNTKEKYVALHFTPGGTQRIIEVLLVQDLIPPKGIRYRCIGEDPVSRVESYNLKCSVKIMDKITKNADEQYPLIVIEGPEERTSKELTIINTVDKTTKKINVNELVKIVSGYMKENQLSWDN